MFDSSWLPRVKARIECLPLFRRAEYRRLNPEIGPWDELDHYAELGLHEGRTMADAAVVAACLGSVSRRIGPPAPLLPSRRVADLLIRAAKVDIAVHVSSTATVASLDLAGRIAYVLRRLGIGAEVKRSLESQPVSGKVRILVSPAEFYAPAQGLNGLDPAFLESSFVAERETLTAPGFQAQLGSLLLAQGVISPDSGVVALMKAANIPSVLWLPSELEPESGDASAHPLVAGLSRRARQPVEPLSFWADRPIDVVFIGEESKTRDTFLGRNADLFSTLECAFLYRRALWTITGERVIDPEIAAYLGRRAKIVLNLHRDEIGVLDGDSAVLNGMACGALVVSLPCTSHPLFEAGIHYLEDSAVRLPKLIRWLLHTREGRATAERVRGEAAVRLAQAASTRRLGLAILDLLLSPLLRS